MPRTLAAEFPVPDPAGHFSGASILGTDAQKPGYGWDTLIAGANYLLAHHHAAPVVNQPIGDDLCQRTAVGFAQNMSWPIPRLTDQHGALDVWIRCERRGASGDVRLNTTVADEEAVLNAPAIEGWVSTTITVEFDADDLETLSLSTQGDGADPVVVHAICAQWTPLASPLALTVDGEPVWDAVELDPGEPLSAADVRQLLAQLQSMLARRRVWWNLSGIQNSSNADALSTLGRVPHEIRVPVYADAEAIEHALSIRVSASGLVGEASEVLLRNVDEVNHDVRWAVADGAPPSWLTGTLALPQPEPETPVREHHVHLRLWPGAETTANVHHLLVYGS